MRYETGVPVGRGATGEVLKAWDPTLQRHVAIKLLKRDEVEAVPRMLREAQAQARVDHPNVGRVYEVGETETGHPYIAMEFIDGRPLGEVIDDLRLEEKVRLLRTVAEAVQAAHTAGLIHRDLKPGNILVERREDGSLHPYVVDFGLARERSLPEFTQTGQAVGTPGYMSPEQARGDVRDLDRRTDVFSLGVILYEMVTGRLPFEGESDLESMIRLLEEEPTPPRKVASQAPADLETIVLKCLEKERSKRYDSARALADDLGRYLAGEPIAARPVGVLRRLEKRIRRRPGLSALIAVSTVGALLLAGWALQERRSAAQRAAVSSRFTAEAERIEAFLRAERLAPLHDLSPALAEIEERIDGLRRRAASLGTVASGPRDAALGRAFLALRRFDEAHDRLERAWEAGERDEATALALGRARAERYLARLERTRRIFDPEARAVAETALTEELRDPAVELLRRGAGALAAAPEAVEARIAMIEGRYEAAASLAATAADRVSWLYEARLIEARSLRFLAFFHQQAGEREAAAAAFERAGSASDAAVAVGRSAAEAHVSVCSTHRNVMNFETRTGSNPNVSIEERAEAALAAAERALVAHPNESRAYSCRSGVYALVVRTRMRRGEVVTEEVRLAQEAGRRAIELEPDYVWNYAVLGNVLLDQLQMSELPENAAGIAVEAQRVLRAGVEIDPNDVYLWNSLGNVQLLSAIALDLEATADREALAAAESAYRRAIEVASGWAVPWANLSHTLRRRADLEPDFDIWIERAIKEGNGAVAVNPEYIDGYQQRAAAHARLAREIAERGDDPTERLHRAEADLDRIREIAGRVWKAEALRAAVELERAEWDKARGGDFRDALRRADEAIESVAGMAPNDPELVELRHRAARLRGDG